VGRDLHEHRPRAVAGRDVIYTPRGNWHGFDNTSDEDVLLFWGWSGAGSLEAAGYAVPGPDDEFDA
jgi:oxalate decarboxylase/phosphoglucose isomerase-like protein (cupin superfamily)